MRPTAVQAMVRVQEYIDFLEMNGVPTALFKERVQAVHAWGKSVRLRQPDAANPRSEEMKGIQRALDDAVASENFVRENRKRHPFYPYQTEEQHRLAEMLSGIDISEKAKQSIFKGLHGGDGKKSLLREDLQDSKLLTLKGIDSCARNLPTYAPHVPTPAEEKRAPVAMMRRLCSVKWNVETIDIDSANGDTQTVDIQWRDACLAVQHHFLTAEYTEDELLFEPQIAERLADIVFDDYCSSLIYYLQCSYLPEGQYPLLYVLLRRFSVRPLPPSVLVGVRNAVLAVQKPTADERLQDSRSAASVATTSASPTTTQSTSLLRALASNAAVGAHPNGRLRLDGILPTLGSDFAFARLQLATCAQLVGT